MSDAALRVAVLISGTGSNLKTLIDARDRIGIDLVRVISSRAAAPGLEHARRAGIGFEVVAHRDALQQDREVARSLQAAAPDLVVLAGYMRILGPEPVRRFGSRMINLHPSLLPLYPGLDTYARVLQAGDREHGASIHFVTEDLDAGPVISQVRVPVVDGDTPQQLAARLGPREHALIRATVELFARRRVELGPDTVLLNGQALHQPLLLGDDDRFDTT